MAIIGPLKLKVQLLRDDEPAIGPGKALVLEAIAETGSISAAGRQLGMSYRRTWLLVESLNSSWVEPAVATKVGGGANLTPFGTLLVAKFRGVEERMAAAATGSDYEWMLAALKP